MVPRLPFNFFVCESSFFMRKAEFFAAAAPCFLIWKRFVFPSILHPPLKTGRKILVSCNIKGGVQKKLLKQSGIFDYLKAAPTRVFSARRGCDMMKVMIYI